MIIECTSCRSKYQYDEDRFERKPSKKIRCAKCQQVFEIFNPAFAQKQAAQNVGESTFHKREQIQKKEPETTAQAPAPVAPQAATGPALGALQMPQGKRLSLAIIEGPDAGHVFRIEKPRVTIGRSGADLTLSDTEASRLHAAVEVRDTAYTVADLGSTNGTLVDGERIDGPVDLADKGEFQVGASILMLIVTEEA